MKILIISDLHIGKKARTKDLCPYPEAIHKDDKLVSSFFDSAKDYIDANGEFDYLIIPGDITNHSNLIEYDCASEFIKKTNTELNISNEKIIIVPGNHDVDWSVFEGSSIYEEEKEYRKVQKYNTLTDSSHTFSELIHGELTKEPYINIWNYSDAVFVGYNSSWHDDKSISNHYGYIEQEHIQILKEKLILLKPEIDKKLKFFIVHHHLQSNPNPHPSWRDSSCMQNSQSLIELLAQFSFNFIIHGHKHVPYFYSTKINSSSPLNFLCAGSYSFEIPIDIAGSISNLFHIIEFEDLVKCKGKIISKAYDPTRLKWVDSKENHGIEHYDAFGNEMLYSSIFDLCKAELSTLKVGSYKKFTELINLIPDLEYLQNADKLKLISDLDSELNLSHSTALNKEIIFIKKEEE